MSSELTLILLAYLLIKGVENSVAAVNLRHLAVYGDFVPRCFDGLLDRPTLKKMRDYTVAHGWVDFAGAGVDILITLFFVFGGLLNFYNNWIMAQNWSPLVSGVLFYLILTWCTLFIHIPFSLYNTFHVEEKFGFNTRTVRLWCMDLLKELVLSSILLGLLLSGVFWLISSFPGYWWLIVWGFLLFFKLFILYISPYVIEPLFNKFTPIADEGLEKQIKELMEKAGLTVSRVFSMDSSRRSRHGNAYFSGIGRTKRIVLFDTLLENSRQDEILAILAHEAGHWKKKHIIKRLIVMEFFSFVGIYAAFWLVSGDLLMNLFGLEQATLWSKLLLAAFLGSLVAFPFKPFSTYLSRRHEWEADAFAVELSGNPRALARALARLGKDNLANLHPHPWYVALHYSHPPLTQRIEKLREM